MPDAQPISAWERRALFAGMRAELPQSAAGRPLLLAVSGGPDSLALLVLAAAEQAEGQGNAFAVATVDHGLRAESIAEAAGVARLAARFRLRHAALTWNGPKPASNLAAAARDARYRLLAAEAARLGASAVVTAHHEDDQIETHCLNALRKAGDRGLAGMRPARWLAQDIVLLRPLLPVPRARLRATLEAAGLLGAAIDDPSNRDIRFGRARIRDRLCGLLTDNLAALLEAIATHRERRDAEDIAAARWFEAAEDAGDLRIGADGAAHLKLEAFRAADDAVRRRILGEAIAAVAGAPYPPAAAAIARLNAGLVASAFSASRPFAATLGGACLRGADGTAHLFREWGRSGIASADPFALFDNRFRIRFAARDAVPVGARLVALGCLDRGGPRQRTLPVLLDADGVPIAAHPGALDRLPKGTATLVTDELVSLRLRRSLVPLTGPGGRAGEAAFGAADGSRV